MPSLFGAFGLGQHQVSDEPGHDDGQLIGEEEEEEAAEEEETFESSRGHRGIPQEPVGSPEEPGELLVALLLEGANHVAAGLAASHHEHLQVLLDDLLHDVFLADWGMIQYKNYRQREACQRQTAGKRYCRESPQDV